MIEITILICAGFLLGEVVLICALLAINAIYDAITDYFSKDADIKICKC